MNYNPSTISRIGDLVNGIRVDTSAFYTPLSDGAYITAAV